MNRTRAAFALPAALAALVVLSAVAALASVAARVALRESAALAAEAESHAARAALRARAAIALARAPRGVLLATATLISERDTALAVSLLAWPWHRVVATARGVPVTAELARATAPALPWCAATVTGGMAVVAPGTLSLDPASACAGTSSAATPQAIAAFADSLAAALVLAPTADSLTVYAGAVPALTRAGRRAAIAPGASLSGVVMAPVVIIETGATVRGIVIASETLQISAGASVVGDERAARDALRAYARLHFLGRAGLLLPP